MMKSMAESTSSKRSRSPSSSKDDLRGYTVCDSQDMSQLRKNINLILL